ncbi:MAG TPA: DUF3667 domain-containing protein [Pyrinomonadaceae bacterium]
MAEVAHTAGRAEAGAGLNATAVAPDAERDAPGVCPECEEALVGDFCHRCGEKRPEARDLSVRHFFSEAAQELMSVEHSKLFHTVWALLFRPGFLTNEWVAGRRRRYVKPLNLCLGIFAVSLFAYSAYKPVSLYDAENVIRHDQYGSAKKVFEKIAARKGVPLEAVLERISDRWQRYASLSTLLFILGFAAVLQLFFMFSHRYFVEHLVFSMHFVSFSILTVLLMWPVYFFIGLKPGPVNTTVGVLKWALDIAYMFFAVRAVYRMKTGRTLAAALFLTAGYFLTYMLVFVGAFVVAMVVVIAG